MGDVQSGEWTLESGVVPRLTTDLDIQAAETALNDAERGVWMAEEQLENAKLARLRALGRLEVARLQPKRHQVLNPPVQQTDRDLYLLCMKLGYLFCVSNGTVHFSGSPTDGLIDTGLKLEDLPT